MICLIAANFENPDGPPLIERILITLSSKVVFLEWLWYRASEPHMVLLQLRRSHGESRTVSHPHTEKLVEQ